MAETNPNSNEKYFAARPAEDTAAVLLHRARSFYQILHANSYLEKMARMWDFYHGQYYDSVGYGHRVNFSGEQGELVQIPVNHFRNLAQHIYTIITATRPVMDARAINMDYKSLAQTHVANGILDYYMRERKLEVALKKAVEMAVVLGSGFIKMEWNSTEGELYDVDDETGKFTYQGDAVFTVISQFDVVVDGTKETWDNEWILTRTFKNKYNLMTKFPELADKIAAIPAKSEVSRYRLNMFSNDETDDIPVFEFYHKRTEAMPDGRYLLFVASDIIMLDTKLPYREIPVYRIVPSEIMGTPYGYSPMFDIYPIQECINSLYSTIMTNQNAFGVQNVFVPRGADITIAALEGGMNVIEANAKPEPINLTQTPAEIFKFLEFMIESGETISGINSVARGNPESSLRSGNALALVQSMAIQFISGLQQSYVQLIEDVGTGLLNILKDFAATPRTIQIVGKNNRTYLKEFTGEDLDSISRVVVDMGNPLSRCLAKDTPILMYDGSIKMVQDIKTNEQIMGPDSEPRTVSSTAFGQEMMYEVTSKDKNRNIKYGCNESHILTLRYCSDDYRYNVQKGQIIDISIRDYLKLPARHKRLLQGFTSSVEFNKKDLPIPPYILGAWLGDGNSLNTCLTSMDSEIVDSWYDYAKSIKMEVRITENRQPNKSKNYFITSGQAHGKSDRNPFMNHLRGLELINNKHIPNRYNVSSREDRLQLLAGLLDTDGTLLDQTFIFTQKSDQLSNDVVYLAKSLGFRVTIKKRKTNISELCPVAEGEVNVISIGGNTNEIPTKLIRKQAIKKEKAREWLNYGINVTPIGEGTYYGFTLKEEPHFMLGDFTVTHNTTAGRVQMAEQLLQMKLLETPEQYFQVLDTGRLDVTFQGTQNELMNIQQENELLMDGKPAIALQTDKHQMHMIEHKAVLSDPDLRQNAEFVKNANDHIEQHLNMLRTTDPGLLSIYGETPLPPLQPPMPPGAPQMGPPNAPPPGMPPAGPQPTPMGRSPQMANTMMPPSNTPGPGQSIANGSKIVKTPTPAKVPSSLLPSPSLQQEIMGNVNLKK